MAEDKVTRGGRLRAAREPIHWPFIMFHAVLDQTPLGHHL